MKRLVYCTFVVIGLLQGIGTSAAQGSPRVPPGNNNLIAAYSLMLEMDPAVPTVHTVPNMAEADLEAGELVHTCGTDNSTGSVWYQLASVGGQLVIDTAGSNIDTIMTLYEAASLPSISLLDAVACAETGPGGAVQARLSVNLPAGRYYLQVSNNDPVKPPDASVTVSASFDPTSDAKAPGDNFAKAKPVKFGKRVTISNIAYATTEAAETTPTCVTFGEIRSTVWLKFDALLAGELSANMFGSNFDGPVSQMIMAVYREDVPGVLTEVLCDAGGNTQFDAPNVLNAPITPGRHYIQLGLRTDLNALPATRFMFSAGIDLVPTTLQSGDFDGDNSKWKIGGLDGGSAIELEPVDSLLTDNVFACRPPSAGKISLKQKVNLGGLRFKSEMIFQLSLRLAASLNDHYSFTANIIVKYADGTTAKATRTATVRVGSLTITGLLLPIPPGNMTGATLKITCAPPAGQMLYFDDLTLALRTMTPYREAEGGVLPLPLPPSR